MLRGIFKGAPNHGSFSRVFDWFYPIHFQIIENSLKNFIADEETVYLIFKFASDLLDNSHNRLKFDTWSVNGLVIFKEVSSLMI